MPADDGGKMPDFRTILLIVALGGGSNLLTYFGLAAPAQTTSAEATANAEFIRDELHLCIKELKECHARCVVSVGWVHTSAVGTDTLLASVWWATTPSPVRAGPSRRLHHSMKCCAHFVSSSLKLKYLATGTCPKRLPNVLGSMFEPYLDDKTKGVHRA